MARVVIDHLSKVFEGPKGESIRALEGVNLTIEDKELVVLLGPSASGKTTLLRLISGLEEPTGGEIFIGGKSLKNVPPGKRDIAMVFQSHALYPHMSAYENMAFGLKVRKCGTREIGARVSDAAEMLGLTDCLDRKPKELSGGQRQRVALGRAIVRRPEVFLFDEPLSNLDAQLRVKMRTEIAKLHKQLEATMVYVTHDQAEAMTMGERMAVMNCGTIQQIGKPLSVYEQPANLFVAGFVGSPQMNFFDVSVVGKDGGLFIEEPSDRGGAPAGPGFSKRLQHNAAGLLKEYIGKKIVLGIRPEKTYAEANATGNGENIEAVVELMEPVGSEIFLHLGRGSRTIVARIAGGTGIRVNEKLKLNFDMNQANFFDPQTGEAIDAG